MNFQHFYSFFPIVTCYINVNRVCLTWVKNVCWSIYCIAIQNLFVCLLARLLLREQYSSSPIDHKENMHIQLFQILIYILHNNTSLLEYLWY